MFEIKVKAVEKKYMMYVLCIEPIFKKKKIIRNSNSTLHEKPGNYE